MPAVRASGAADGVHASAAPCPAPASAEQAGACRTQCPRRPMAGGASRSTASAGEYPAGASGAAGDAVPGPGTARAASAELARMQRDAPDNPWVSGYLWALSCRSGGIAAAGCSTRPPHTGSLADSEHRADTPLSFADYSYAAQLLLQAGAWDTLLLLGRPFGTIRFLWSKLPLPLLRGLLDAPVSFRMQWCADYIEQSQRYSLPADAAEWLLYAAIAQSCGQVPQLTSADEQTLRQSGSIAAITGLSYYMLLLAAEVHPQGNLPL